MTEKQPAMKPFGPCSLSAAFEPGSASPGRPRRAGFSTFEALAALFILMFAISVTAQLYVTGMRVRRVAQNYSQVQTDLRSALRDATRAVRHGYQVMNPSSLTAFPNVAPNYRNSNANQLIVQVPDSTGAKVEIRYYLSSGGLYEQRSSGGTDQLQLSGIQTLTFNYYKTSGGTRTAVDGSSPNDPSKATEVQVTVTATNGVVTEAVSVLVALRNHLANQG